MMHDMPDRVTAAELVRQFGCWQERAIIEPVHVTHHGRDRLVLMSARAYGKLLARRAEDRPAAAGDDMAVVLAHMAQSYLALDRHMAVIEANPVACAHLRLARAELVGRPLLDAVPVLRGSLFQAHAARAIETGEAYAFDTPAATAPGRWSHVQLFPIRDGVGALFRDITEQLSARAVADGRAAMMAALGAHGGVGMAILSPRGAFGDVDATFGAMAGFAPDALRHVRMTDVLAIDRRVAAGRALDVLMTGGPATAFESTLLVNGGDKLAVRIALAPLAGEHAPDGAVMAMTAACSAG